MSVLNQNLQTMVCSIEDVTGRVSQQKLHARIFDAYEAKGLVLVEKNEAGHETVLEGWGDLSKANSESKTFRLLPRRAKTNAGYAIMRSIVEARGSPFTMDDRKDPVDLKLIFRPVDRESVSKFNMKNDIYKVGPQIHYDGIMCTPTDSALIIVPMGGAHIAAVNQAVGTINYLKEWSAGSKTDQERHGPLRGQWEAILSRRMHVFMGTTALPTKDVSAYARKHKIHLYIRQGSRYVFHAMKGAV